MWPNSNCKKKTASYRQLYIWIKQTKSQMTIFNTHCATNMQILIKPPKNPFLKHPILWKNLRQTKHNPTKFTYKSYQFISIKKQCKLTTMIGLQILQLHKTNFEWYRSVAQDSYAYDESYINCIHNFPFVTTTVCCMHDSLRLWFFAPYIYTWRRQLFHDSL